MSNKSLSIIVEFDECVPQEGLPVCTWWVHIITGEWDTYREAMFTSPTKPTARQLRKAVKEFMHPVVQTINL